ncbi:MAG TPA: molybdopterin-dependent oxidoreductase [Candidatus Dormibacteraeota bacterium]|nr:molybdopterin-dependent oxidoreductase [Candidatus Dormibacteraeota bacterium]
MAVVIKGGCAHDCPDTCAWEVTVERGRAVKLAGAPDHPYTRGTLCAKVHRYLDRVYSPERVLRPLRRVGPKGEGVFVPVSWEEALTDIAARLGEVAERWGGEAVLPYSYAGNMGLIQYASMDRRFFARLGASRLARTICGDTAGAGIAAALGTTTGVLPEDVQHARFIVLWGTNTVVTNLHLWPFVRRAREAGARLVVVDPVRTRTAREADWHVRPLPGTDAALALGMMHVIVAEGLHDEAYLRDHCNGWPELRARLAEYPPERAAGLAGVEREEIVRLARAYATTRPALIRTLVGAEKQPLGATSFRTIACLPAVVGAWRELGGGLAHWTRSLFAEAVASGALTGPHPRTRVVNMVQLGHVLTDPGLSPPVKALFVYNSNPATTAPNAGLVCRGLAREDLFTVVHDLFITDTARYADYLLPATSFLEHLDLLVSWGHTYLTLNQPALPPRGESVCNTELFRRLAAAMGWGEEPGFRETDEDLIRRALSGGHPYLEGIDLESLRRQGWAPLHLPASRRVPFAQGGFPTASGRCELMADPEPGFAPQPADPRHPLVLISAKHAVHFLNSSYAHLPWHRRAEGETVVSIHPEDAAPRGIADGDRVRLRNHRGRLTARARVDDTVRPGVVAIAHGRWRSLEGGTANDLTSDGLADRGGGGDLFGTRVEVEPA